METPTSSWFNCVLSQKPPSLALPAEQWRPNSARRSLVWNESQDSLLPPRKQQVCSSFDFNFCLRYRLFFFMKKIISQFKETGGISVQIALTVLTGYFWCRKKLFFLTFYKGFYVIILYSVCYCRPNLPVNMDGPFVMLVRWMFNWRDKNVIKVYV